MLRISMFRALIVSLAISLIAAALVVPAHHAKAAGDCTVDASIDSEEQAFLMLINQYRQQNGRGPLTLSYGLSKPSQWKSVDMAKNKYFAHDDLNRTWVQRIRDCGYGYNTAMAENIAAGYQTAQAVFDAWRNSPGHNANMLGTGYTAIGIGRYFDAASPYGWYWTTDFGGVSDGFVSANNTPPPAATATPTRTPVPPTATLTRTTVPPTATPTRMTLPPTATPTRTATTVARTPTSVPAIPTATRPAPTSTPGSSASATLQAWLRLMGWLR